MAFDIPHFLRLRRSKRHGEKKQLEISWPTDVQHNAGLMPPHYHSNGSSFESLAGYRSASPFQQQRVVKRPYPSVEESLREEKEKLLRERGEPVMNRRRRSRTVSMSHFQNSQRCICGRC